VNATTENQIKQFAQIGIEEFEEFYDPQSQVSNQEAEQCQNDIGNKISLSDTQNPK
jgi:hypothetical protein